MLIDDTTQKGPRPATRTRLLLLGPYYRPLRYGGAVQVYHNLLARLEQVDAVVLSQRQGADAGEMREFDEGCPRAYGYGMRRVDRFDLIFAPGAGLMHRLADSLRFFVATRAQWREAIREVNPDVIVCGSTITAGWLMDHIPGRTPFVNYIHGEEFRGSNSRFVHQLLFKKQIESIRKAALNICVSRYTAGKVMELAQADPAKVVVLPNFVDLQRFTAPADREATRRDLGWSGRKVILTLSRLVKKKGVDQALRAVASLRQEGKLSPDWLHVIAGTGDQEEELRRMAVDLNVSRYTAFEGFVPDNSLARYYGAADLFLHPNRDLSGDTEGFGIVFLEASACGTPVIGGIAGGTADAIREGVTGFRVDAESLPAIAEAILKLANSEELRRRMARDGVELVRREHRVETAAAKFEQLIRSAAVR